MLYSHVAQVDAANASRLQNLTGECKVYKAVDSTKVESEVKILNDTRAPLELCLKVDAQVMLLKNVDTQLVNGNTNSAFNRLPGKSHFLHRAGLSKRQIPLQGHFY